MIELNNETKIKIHFLHDNGMTFKDVAKEIGGISAFEACQVWTQVEQRKNATPKEKVVYRKKINLQGVKKRHRKFAELAKTLLD
ncbi:hypothetical protein KNT64_gp139 [Pseudomonas phage PspYZU05]|uniref:Uncharacterized protein n=1 Tax=Pseudomonas phage PspYZU05 TaxID=1983556 RepID=A0A2U7NF49_9CAUD|nr:hypothetical protein KNT64_gp139 [Pseudomonas phage PspYZU05]ASD52091.1 hypothetical protein PspYZU05_139 [Pseudomonas phage PspYZU05]